MFFLYRKFLTKEKFFWKTGSQCIKKIVALCNPALTVALFSTTRPQDLCFCLTSKKYVKVKVWMLCIFILDTFQNKLYIVGCWLAVSLAVKYARNKSHRAWSLSVWDTDKTLDILYNTFQWAKQLRVTKGNLFNKDNII